jgi:hypothetical protein
MFGLFSEEACTYWYLSRCDLRSSETKARFQRGAEIFPIRTIFIRILKSNQSVIQWLLGTSFPEVNRLMSYADRSLSSIFEV